MKNIVLIGMPGSGKTTIGKLLAKELSLSFFDSDQHIEKTQNLTISQIFEQFGEEHFRNLETAALKELLQKTNSVISTGGGIVKKEENIDLLKKSSIVIFINRPLENLLSDIDTESRPLLKDGKQKLVNLFEQRFDLYKKACSAEVLNNDSLESVIKKIISEVLKND